MLRALVLALVALSLAAPAAQAGAPVAWQHKALSVAQRTWHPSCGTFTIRFAPVPDGLDVERLRGWATLGQCQLSFPEAHEWLGYPEFCTWVLHEGGHGAGFTHRARGIMRPVRTVIRAETSTDGGRTFRVTWPNADRRCLR